MTTAAKQNKAEFGEWEIEERYAKKKAKKIYGIPGNNTFLPYNKGYSEANERATRWAHRSDVKVGDWKLVSYHQRWYTIEKFDDSELKYQVTKHVKAKELQLYINKWEEQYGQSFSESMGEFHNEIDDINRETTQYGKRGSNSNVDVFEYAQEDNTVRRLDENKNNQRQTTFDTRRSNARSDIDSQRKSLRLDSAYLSAVERGDMETAQK